MSLQMKSLFQRQNILLKMFFIGVGFSIAIFCKINTLAIVVSSNLILFLPSFEILKSFFVATLKLSFFWIFYLLCCQLMDIPFDEQIRFLLRFLLMLQLSAFLLKSFSKERFLSEFQSLLKYKFFLSIYYFFSYVIHIFKYISDRYKSVVAIEGKHIEKIMLIIKSLFKDTEKIKQSLPQIEFDDIKKTSPESILSLSNIYLLGMICLYTLFLVFEILR